MGLVVIHSSFLGSRISSRMPLDSGFSSAWVRLGAKHRFRGQSVTVVDTRPVGNYGDEYVHRLSGGVRPPRRTPPYMAPCNLRCRSCLIAAAARHFQ